MKGISYARPEGRQHAVELCLITPMATVQMVEHLRYPIRQCLERWLAKDPRYAGHMTKPIIPTEDKDEGRRTDAGRQAAAASPRRLGVSVSAVHNWGIVHRDGGMAALRTRNRNARLGIDKCVEFRIEVTGTFAASKGGYGYRRIKTVSEKTVRRIVAEDGLTAHVPKRRCYSSFEGETTPAPDNLADRNFTAEAKRKMTRGHHRDQGHEGTAGGCKASGAFRPQLPLPATGIAWGHGPLQADEIDEH